MSARRPTAVSIRSSTGRSYKRPWPPLASATCSSARSWAPVAKTPSCYVDGRVSYAKLAATELFREGLDRLLAGMREHRIALMCAEREPLDCHRTILVARELEKLGVPVTHILPDGSLEPNRHAIERLAADLKLVATDLFRTPRRVARRRLREAGRPRRIRKDREDNPQVMNNIAAGASL